jgi:hypothetical protein
LILVTTLLLTAEGITRCQQRPLFFLPLLLSGAGVGLLGLLNPIAIVIPGVLYGIALLGVAWKLRARPGALALVVGCGVWVLIVIFADPYYLQRFIIGREHIPLVTATTESHQPFVRLALHRLAEIVNTLAWGQPFLLRPYFGWNFFAVPVIATAVALYVSLLTKRNRYRALVLIGLAPLFIIILELMLLPVFHGLGAKGDLYLLEPYFVQSVARVAYLWYLAILLLALMQGMNRVVCARVTPVLPILAITLLMIPARIARDAADNDVRMTPRAGKCLSATCATEDDRVVLGVLREKFELYIAAGGSLNFNKIPKVLLPNALVVADNEKWIMPTGASRIFPLAQAFPAAFFYFQGSKDYTYERYVTSVCESLDLAWLKERNIQFLFVPADRGDACIYGLEHILMNSRLVARSGAAAAVQLF